MGRLFSAQRDSSLVPLSRGLINFHSRKATGFHRQAELFELNFFSRWLNQAWAKSSSQTSNLYIAQPLMKLLHYQSYCQVLCYPWCLPSQGFQIPPQHLYFQAGSLGCGGAWQQSPLEQLIESVLVLITSIIRGAVDLNRNHFHIPWVKPWA